ncbi:MAG: hypothetical protein CMJ78_21720 [Planctomycetaceae bacterium]|nr:hypothetical protein [Planctomycetaceae bacterium]
MTSKKSILFAVLVLLTYSAQAVNAQTSNLFGSSNSNRNTTGTNSRATGNNTTTQGPNNNGQFQSLLNTEAGTGSVSTDFGNGFVGRSDNAGRFIGNQFTGQQQSRISQGGGFGNFGRGGGFNSGNFAQFGRYGQGQSRKSKIRPRQRIAFTFPKLSSTVIASSVKVQFTQLSTSLPVLKGLGIKVDDKGKATLSGTVTSDRERRLAANLVRLEPGVRSIQNNLEVAAAKPETKAETE